MTTWKWRARAGGCVQREGDDTAKHCMRKTEWQFICEFRYNFPVLVRCIGDTWNLNKQFYDLRLLLLLLPRRIHSLSELKRWQWQQTEHDAGSARLLVLAVQKMRIRLLFSFHSLRRQSQQRWIWFMWKWRKQAAAASRRIFRWNLSFEYSYE